MQDIAEWIFIIVQKCVSFLCQCIFVGDTGKYRPAKYVTVLVPVQCSRWTIRDSPVTNAFLINQFLANLLFHTYCTFLPNISLQYKFPLNYIVFKIFSGDFWKPFDNLLFHHLRWVSANDFSAKHSRDVFENTIEINDTFAFLKLIPV